MWILNRLRGISPGCGHRSSRWGRPLCYALLAWATCGASASFGHNLYPQIPAGAQTPELLPSQEDILPEQIERLPGVRAELEVIHRRSQLVVARTPIVRTAIADPNVIEIVPYSPNEIGV